MKRILFLLVAFALSLPTPLRAQNAEALAALVGVLKEVDDPAFHLDILKGISAALKGQRNIKMPKGWKEIAPKLAKSSNADVRQLAQTVSLTFGSKAALDALRKVLVDGKANLADRQKALAALVAARDRALPEVLRGLLLEKALRREALRALGAFEDPKTSAAILKIYTKLDTAGKLDALMTLASRVSFAKALMAAVARGVVKSNELPADIVRQLRAHGVKDINVTLDKVWGVSRSTPAEVVTVAKRDVAAIDPQDFSMMPEGLVLALKVDELRDLVAYLRGSRQVALPEKPGKEQ